MTVYDLWCEYVDYRRGTIKLSTLHYYEEIIGHKLRDCPQSLAKALEVRTWLLRNTTQAYTARVLQSLGWAVNWGIQHQRIDLDRNIYTGIAKQTKPTSQAPPPDAFNSEEKERVLNTFVISQHYDYYFSFVYFLFLTGCRPSEAIGLRWGDIGKGFKKINFTSSIVQVKSKRIRTEKSKTNRIRTFPVYEELRDLLEACLKGNPDPASLVFPSRENPDSPIIYTNFCKRAWEKTVDPIVERSTTPYSCRDTFITEQIVKNVPVPIIAGWVDNSPDMIYKRYFDISAAQIMPR